MAIAPPSLGSANRPALYPRSTVATPRSSPADEVRDRLLGMAWRDHRRLLYELIAERMAEREADILRRMAAAESGHRAAPGAPDDRARDPDPRPAHVKIPLWLRLQTKIAPVDRLLAAREAAEDEEVDDLYKRSTGDPRPTACSARSARRNARTRWPSRTSARRERQRRLGPDRGRLAAGVPGAQAQLEKILGREKCHRAGGGCIWARSTAPTTGSPPCSGSSPACPARRAVRRG